MVSGPEAIVRGPAMEANSADDTILYQLGDETVNRSWITTDVEIGRLSDLLQGDRLFCGDKDS